MRGGRKYEGPGVCLDLDWTKKDVTFYSVPKLLSGLSSNPLGAETLQRATTMTMTKLNIIDKYLIHVVCSPA